MRNYLSGLVVLLAGLASEATAQQNIITAPPGGIPIVGGGWYAAGTVFNNGMAYPPGMQAQDVAPVAQTTYYAPSTIGYPSIGTTYYSGMYSPSSYYSPGMTSFGLGYSFGTGYGYNRGYTGFGFSSYPGYSGYSNYGSGYGRSYSGNRGYSGNSGYSGNRGFGNGSGGRRR